MRKKKKPIFKKLGKEMLMQNGRFSRKSVMMLTAFVSALCIGLYIVVSDFLLDKEMNKYVIEVFNSLMLLVGALSGVTVWDKTNNSTLPPEPDDEDDDDPMEEYDPVNPKTDN